MSRKLTVLSYLLLCMGVFSIACGDDSVEYSPQDARLPVEALDGAPFGPEGVKQTPGQVFSFHMLRIAAELEASVVREGRALDDPKHSEAVASAFQSVLLKSEGIRDEGFVADCLSVETVPLNRGAAPRVELDFFSVGGLSRVLKTPILHPASKSGDWSELPLLSAPIEKGTPHAVYCQTVPTFDRMTKAAKTGTCLWLVGPTKEVQHSREAPAISSIEGRNGRTLPSALVFTDPRNRRALFDAAATKGSMLSCRVGTIEDAPASMVVGRIKGVGSSRRLIIRTRGRRERFGTEAGSASLELAVMLDVARVLAINLSRKESWRPSCDIEFVHVMDRGGNGGFLTATKDGATPKPVIGVIEIADVAPQNTGSSSLTITFDPSETPSALERSVVQVGSGFLGKPGAWKGLFVRSLSTPRVSEEQAHSLGQDRVPTVSIAACSRSDSNLRTLPSIWDLESTPGMTPLKGTLPVPSVLAGTPKDRVAVVATKQLTQAVSAGRLVLLITWYTSHAVPIGG